MHSQTPPRNTQGNSPAPCFRAASANEPPAERLPRAKGEWQEGQQSARQHVASQLLQQNEATSLDRNEFAPALVEAAVILRRHVVDALGGHHHVAGLDVQIDTAAGAGADERVGTAFVELLHSDGSGGTADAGGAGGDLLPQQGAGPDVELPVIRDLLGVVKQGGDGRDPARVTGQDAVAADIPLSTGNVELLCKLLHKITSLCNFQNVCFSVTPLRLACLS